MSFEHNYTNYSHILRHYATMREVSEDNDFDDMVLLADSLKQSERPWYLDMPRNHSSGVTNLLGEYEPEPFELIHELQPQALGTAAKSSIPKSPSRPRRLVKKSGPRYWLRKRLRNQNGLD
jgi:hypothetical protein